MPRVTRTRRPTRVSAGSTATLPPAASLFSALARADGVGDLLSSLHQYALDATGGSASLLFEHNPRNGALQATSGFGLDALPTDPWIPDGPESTLLKSVFAGRRPVVVDDPVRQMPDLAGRLAGRGILLIPLLRGDDRIGILTVALAPGTVPSVDDGTVVADAFLTAIDLSRLRQRDELQRELRQLLDDFYESIRSTLQIASALDIFCHGANRLFAADRTSVWIHERRARMLVLEASSDQQETAEGTRVAADDQTAIPAAALRRARAELLPGPHPSTASVTVPLRGCRRALGAIVFEGVRLEAGGELELLDRADELGRELSSAIENLQLLDDVLRSRRELENTFDSIAHLVAVVDTAGRIVHVNKAFAARLGRAPEDLLEQPLAGAVGMDLANWVAEVGRESRAADGRGATSREIADPALNGSFLVTVTDLLNPERERVGTVIVARDLTPQVKLEAEREQLRQRLTQSEKLAALGQFVAGIAHELNNPLQGVLGHLELLRVTGAFPKQLRREVQTIYREADRAAKIVRNLLVFAGSRQVARRSVSLNAVMQKVVALRAAACRAQDIEVVRHYDDKLPRVQSDPLLLHQVFLNMVMNAEHAIAATGAAGRIELATRAAAGGDRIVATVRDTGCGIAPDALPRLFEPFYTTKEVGKGTGLGLAIAYGIVQDHGGQITAANHPEGGAVFTVELPVASND